MESKPVICVSICESTLEAFEHAHKLASDSGDVVELRLDCLDEAEFVRGAEVVNLLQNSKRPTIVTYRPIEEGGRQLQRNARIEFWRSNPPATFFDIEFDLIQSFAGFETLDWSRVICSAHDFSNSLGGTDLVELYRKMAATPARILKIAVHVDDVTDCLPLFTLLDRAQKDGRELIAIAMGAAGVATRILGPSRGSFLTYATLNSGKSTGPGQLSLRDLTETYHIRDINRETAIFGLLGFPVGHSVSPQVHNASMQGAGINAVYIPFESHDPSAFLRRMVHPATREMEWNFRGLSVTAPHKTSVMDHLDWIDPEAKEIGAVNTIFVDGNLLRGLNTDARSFLQPLQSRFGQLKGQACALIGAGGAANAAVWALSKEGAEVTVLARNSEKGQALARKYHAHFGTLENQSLGGFEVVINATPLGTAGTSESQSVVTSEQLLGTKLAYDLVYNPGETRFMREARAAGCETLGGMEMFVAQAAAQFKLWTGLDAQTDLVRTTAERALKLK